MVSPLILSLKRQKNLYGSRIKLLSPAKINLYLNILGRDASGFHRIESIVERVSLFDTIDLRVRKEPEVRVFSSEKSLRGEENSCVKAACALKKELKIPFGFDIFLRKRIPLGSGLGGGSSNAAITLLGINTLLNLKLTKEKLYPLGAKLGSDVNFFLSQNRFAFLFGRGEKVFPFKGKTLRHLIIWPKIKLSTKKVYEKYEEERPKLTKFFSNVKILRYGLKRGDTFLLKKSIFNVLEKPALSMCEESRKIKEHFNRNGIFSRLTGSGSAFYTILEGKLPYNNKEKRWLVFTVQTF